jgi:hypothetical protein
VTSGASARHALPIPAIAAATNGRELRVGFSSYSIS